MNKEEGRQILTSIVDQIETTQDRTLRQFHSHLSQTQPTLREGFFACYPEMFLDPAMVLDTDLPNFKKVQRYDGDKYPVDVWTDHKGRPIRISEYGRVTKFTYDIDGYLTEASRKQGPGYGWDRKFTYQRVAGQKQLTKLEIQRYYDAGSINQPKRGEPRRVDVINFGPTGRPDNLITLVDV